MANFIINNIKVRDKIEEFKEAFLGEDGKVDFNKVIPQPKDLDIDSGSRSWREDMQYFSMEELLLAKQLLPIFVGIYNMSKIKTQDDFVKEVENYTIYDRMFMSTIDLNYYSNSLDNFFKEVELKARGFYNIKKYGSTDWYNWRIANWGTKWNASPDSCIVEMDESKGELYLSFTTAWDAPFNIYSKLAERFDFSVCYSDEDKAGSNKGLLIYKNGKLNTADYFDYLNEDDSYLMGCIIWGEDEETLQSEMDELELNYGLNHFSQLQEQVAQFI